jgi:PmbA protein
LKGKELAAHMLDLLTGQGASEAEVFLEEGSRLRIDVRKGVVEYLKREDVRGIGLRVYVGQRMAFVNTADFDEKSLEKLAAKGVELAKMAGSDPANGLPRQTGKVRATSLVDQKLFSTSLEEKLERLVETERLAMEYHPLIKLSNGAAYTDLYRTVTVANTHGLAHTYEETKLSTDVSVVAVKGDDKKDGWDRCRRRRYRLLRKPSEMAAIAAQRALSLVGGKPVPSQEVPVVFDARAAGGLVGGLAGGVNGKEVFLGNSFLSDMLGKKVASPLVTIHDDGTLLPGVGSSPVDGEGVGTQKKTVIQKGVLKLYLYDTYGARKAGAETTGNAGRGSYDDLPGISVTNFYMDKGEAGAEDLIKDVEQGLYVQETIGFGTNTTTGGYSAGAFGRWIEKGQLTAPVAQVTIAGDLIEIFSSIDAIGDDLDFNGRICSPSFRVARMTVAGT